jgi:hypothetical protein
MVRDDPFLALDCQLTKIHRSIHLSEDCEHYSLLAALMDRSIFFQSKVLNRNYYRCLH